MWEEIFATCFSIQAPYSCSLPVTHGLSWYDNIVATGMDYKALLLSVKIQ